MKTAQGGFFVLALHKLDGIIGVIGERNKLEAVIVLKVSDYWYSDERFLEELSIFVHPDYRRAKILVLKNLEHLPSKWQMVSACL